MFGSKQRYKCLNCNHKFTLKDLSWVRKAYLDYTVHKQTFSELKERYGKSENTIRKYFDELNSSSQSSLDSKLNRDKWIVSGNSNLKQILLDKPNINLIMDTTFFGMDFGVMVFRGNPNGGDRYVNLYWKYVTTEKISKYLSGVYYLRQLYNIASFTVDDRKGLIQGLERRYSHIPIQLCQFHFVKNIFKYTGRPKFNSKLKVNLKLKLQDKPKLELMELVLRLKKLNQHQFQSELAIYLENNLDFIQKRTKDNHKYLHRGIRTALSNIKRNLKYIFAYNQIQNLELNIPKTTNSDEGSFGNWKYKIKLHRHLSLTRKRQMIDEILGQNSPLKNLKKK